MTSTLESFHGEAMDLRLLESRRSEGSLWRHVLLVGRTSGRVREAGAIRIDLRRFDTAARWEILEGRKPLGAILAEHGVGYVSRPRLFFAFEATESTDRLIGLGWADTPSAPGAPGITLYGRQNVLATESGNVLADVVEILPPASEWLRAAEGMAGPDL